MARGETVSSQMSPAIDHFLVSHLQGIGNADKGPPPEACSPFSSLTIAFGFWLHWKAKGLLQLLSANILVFRARAARSAEFLSILVYPLVGHWGKWGGRRAGSAEQTAAMLTHRVVKFHTLGNSLASPRSQPYYGLQDAASAAVKSRKDSGTWKKSLTGRATTD